MILSGGEGLGEGGKTIGASALTNIYFLSLILNVVPLPTRLSLTKILPL